MRSFVTVQYSNTSEVECCVRKPWSVGIRPFVRSTNSNGRMRSYVQNPRGSVHMNVKGLIIAALTGCFLLTSCTMNVTVDTKESGTIAEEEQKNDAQITGAVEGLPEFTVNGSTDLPGNFFLSFVYSRNLIMLDGRGNVVWSKHEEQPSKDDHTGFWDFKKHVIDGKTYYSYHDQIAGYDNFNFEGFAPGDRVLLDENFNEIKRIRFEESDTVEKDHPLDGHDFLMIDPDHYILSGYLKDTIYNHPEYPEGSSVVYSYLQEVDHGKVVWDWKSIDYPELYDLIVTDGSDTADDFANEETDVPDIVHFNAMRLDEDGDLICSLRHLSTIICLDRTKREDQIKWKLSGRGG